MKQCKYLKYLLLITFVALVGCSDSSTDPITDNNSNSGSYFPLSLGSEWTYSRSVGSYSDQYTMMVIGDTTVNNNKYSILSSIEYPSARGLYRMDNSGVYVYSPDSLKELRIELFGKVGDKITSYRSEVKSGITYVYPEIYTVIQKEVSKTVNGKTYKNCIVIKKDTYVDFGDGENLFIGTTETTYSAGVGMIESKGSTSSGAQTAYAYLKSYNIK